MTPPDPAARLERTRAWALALRASFKTIILGTASPAGEPEASIAAAALTADGDFLIYVSGLATHTRQLVESKRASVLLAEDEAGTAQPLARRRLTFACHAAVIPRDNPAFAASLPVLRAKFGPPFELLTNLGDFQLIRLTPQRGRLVAGFGEAYEINPRDWSELTALGRPRA